ncbi:MAG: lanthionine synthetase LanC family protein [Acidobacteriota bacterium]
MSGAADQIGKLLQALGPVGTRAFTWFGRRIRVGMAGLLPALRQHLYSHFYSPGQVVEEAQERSSPPLVGITPFLASLAAAASTAPGYEGPWPLLGRDGERLCIRRGGLRVWLGPQETMAFTEDGDGVYVYRPAGLSEASPGYYLVQGGPRDSLASGRGVLRFYWHLTPEGAVPCLEALVAPLTSVGLPFQLKVLAEPTAYRRCDAGVLYIRRADLPAAASLVTEAWAIAAPFLRDSVPSLTLPLARGLSVAEEPEDGNSFGLHRCGLLAEALIRARDQGRRSGSRRAAVVAEVFAEAGLDLDAPHLGPGSAPLDWPEPFPAGHVRERSRAARTETLPEALAELLASRAIVHGNRCTWVVCLPAAGEAGTRQVTHHATAAPDLYEGDAGIALFLAEVAARTGASSLRRVALGGARQALAAGGELPAQRCHGFYTGLPGIAMAVARIGRLLGEEELLDRVRRLVPRLERLPAEGEWDLIAGRAGTVLALLTLADLLEEPGLERAAIREGETLLRHSLQVGEARSWHTPPELGHANLTGLSHGASGPALALLELFQRSGRPDFREGACQALAYERTHFRSGDGNWLDFRPGRPGRSGKRDRFATAWCHGAPGIVLARLRGRELLRDPALEEEARAGLRTTAEAIESDLRSEHNFCLCHGLLGNLEVLLDGAWGQASELAEEIALRVAETRSSRRAWPCGLPDGEETAGLMMGIAGIGYHYLRRGDPRVPSLLAPRPSALGGTC